MQSVAGNRLDIEGNKLDVAGNRLDIGNAVIQLTFFKFAISQSCCVGFGYCFHEYALFL